MADEIKIETTEIAGQKTRRAFVRTAAQVAVTAPAVAMLLNASTKSASAAVVYSGTPIDDTSLQSSDDAGLTEDDKFTGTGDDFAP